MNGRSGEMSVARKRIRVWTDEIKHASARRLFLLSSSYLSYLLWHFGETTFRVHEKSSLRGGPIVILKESQLRFTIPVFGLSSVQKTEERFVVSIGSNPYKWGLAFSKKFASVNRQIQSAIVITMLCGLGTFTFQTRNISTLVKVDLPKLLLISPIQIGRSETKQLIFWDEFQRAAHVPGRIPMHHPALSLSAVRPLAPAVSKMWKCGARAREGEPWWRPADEDNFTSRHVRLNWTIQCIPHVRSMDVRGLVFKPQRAQYRSCTSPDSDFDEIWHRGGVWPKTHPQSLISASC